MSAEWREAAVDYFPELAADLALAENPMQFWIDLRLAFERAYSEPRNEALIQRIYGFAEWCLQHGNPDAGAGEHLPTCVVVAFYEHIPALPAAERICHAGSPRKKGWR
jgi:hypothetical protein